MEENTEQGRSYADEPLFVVRAKDKTAPETIEAHIELARGLGASEQYINATRARVNEFRDWQNANEELVKGPDN